MTASPRPPRLARRILEHVLPADVREDVSGDVEELFSRRCAREGVVRARLWYWRQAFTFAARFRAERLRERRAGDAPPARARSRSAWWSTGDVKLAARMLIRYPGLTCVSVLGIAVGIMISAGAFAILYTFVSPSLPFDEGERIVAIQNWDTGRNRAERRIVHDFIAWRGELQSVQDLGAFRQVTRNLLAPGRQPEAVRIAEMSAAGFRVPRVAPLLGRPLLDDDEQPDAPPALVIAAEVWRNRFSADPNIVGRVVHLGDTAHTIVGVMPDGFAFPVQDRLWIPFRAERLRSGPREGPSITVFGRLAPGATLAAAQAELGASAQRAALASPATHGKLRAKVTPYTFPFFDIDDPAARWIVHLFQFLITLLLVIVCVNVAILVYARTATRQAEIAVRTALGASRGRIIGQLFVEALALTVAAAAVGLALTSVALEQVNAAMTQAYAAIPFWWVFELSPGLVAYVAVLALGAAAIVGVLPALKATSGRVATGLQQISAGAGGMRLGKTWTVLIVLQVAIAVALLPAAIFHAWDSLRHGLADSGSTAKEFLTVQLVMDPPAATVVASESDEQEFARRFTARTEALARRLEAESAVATFTFSSTVPGGETTAWIAVDGAEPPAAAGEGGGWVASGSRAGHEVRFNRVAPGFFDAIDIPVLTGRGFTAGDTDAADPRVVGARRSAGAPVIVNESFARTVFGGASPLGRRIRYVGLSNDAEPGEIPLGPAYEIVGVVGDFPANPVDGDLSPAKLYHAVALGQVHGGILSLRIRGANPAAFAGRLRELAAAVDPQLQVRNVATLDAVLGQEQAMLRLVAAVLVGLTLSVLVLSAAGIYALMSFTVAQRRKEIGIRTALGADPRRILGSIFSRALRQLAIGAVLGGTVAVLLELATDGGLMAGHGIVVLPIVGATVMIIGLLAVLGPARRGLRVHPTDALREH